jgi:Uma2 family endonuclease
MMLDEFIRLYGKEPFEFVNGVQKPVLPQVAGHGLVVQNFWMALDGYADSHQLGDAWMSAPFVQVNSDNTVTFSYTPDVMYFRAERMANYKQAVPDWKWKPYLLIPDLVVEVVAHDDDLIELDEKIDMYLADGVLMAWVMNPQRLKVSVYTPTPDKPRTKQRTNLFSGDTLTGGDLIPGFEIAVAKIFE